MKKVVDIVEVAKAELGKNPDGAAELRWLCELLRLAGSK